MRAFLMALVAAGALAAFGGNAAAAPANGAALLGAGQATDLVQEARTVYRCKIDGKWRPGRCPDHTRIKCVTTRGERFRHWGHCRSPG